MGYNKLLKRLPGCRICAVNDREVNITRIENSSQRPVVIRRLHVILQRWRKNGYESYVWEKRILHIAVN